MKTLCACLILLLSGCSHQQAAVSPTAKGAELDQRLTNTYLHRDWAALSTIVAPDYCGSGDGFEWNFSDLQREFPKIQLADFHIERQRVKQLAPGVLLVSDVATVRETYAGQDISGRYKSTDVWVLRDGKWLLLVEQETPLK